MDGVALHPILLVFGLILSSAVLAAPRCNEQEFPPVSGKHGYQTRHHGSERCEGLYRSKIASDFEVLSFTRNALLPRAGTLYLSAPVAVLDGAVNIVANSLVPTIYYRMDSRFEAGTRFKWPLDEVVEPIKLTPRDLGVVLWQTTEERMAMVPAMVSSEPGSAPKPDQNDQLWGHLIFRAPVEVEAVYFYKQGDPDGTEQLLEKTFSARQAIGIGIPRWQPQFSNSGLLLVEVHLKPAADDDWISKTLAFKVGALQ